MFNHFFNNSYTFRWGLRLYQYYGTTITYTVAALPNDTVLMNVLVLTPKKSVCLTANKSRKYLT